MDNRDLDKDTQASRLNGISSGIFYSPFACMSFPECLKGEYHAHITRGNGMVCNVGMANDARVITLVYMWLNVYI